MHEVAVTGIGVVSSAGIGCEQFWRGLLSGKSFVRRITRFDASRIPVQIASEIDDSALAPHLGVRSLRDDQRIFAYADLAADAAWNDSRLSERDLSSLRIGVVVGTSVGPSVNAAVQQLRLEKEGVAQSPGDDWRQSFPAHIYRTISERIPLNGFSSVVSTGCTSGADAVGVAAEVIGWGISDVMFVIGAESPIEPVTINAFDAIGALSHRTDEPERASRPFDRQRDGFVMGEGAGVLILERADLARKRHAFILARILGYSTTTDAVHMTAPRHDLQESCRAVSLAMTRAGLTPDKIDYISAHATSTPTGDIVESRLIKRIFGRRAYRLPISSIKSIIGHQSGAAGALQSVANVLMLRHQTVVPTVNLDVKDPECDLDYVPGEPREWPISHVLQHTFGFSGKNSILIFGGA